MKKSVQIVCPHCRRSYVIQVDLTRIYRSSPRAICSRCGGKFEVIQRMSELDDEPAATSDLSSRITPEPPVHTRPETPADPPEDEPDDLQMSTQIVLSDAISLDPDGADLSRQSGSAPASPPPAADREPDIALPPKPRAEPLPPSSFDELGAPVESDLDQPMPWASGARTDLGVLATELPESALVLESLLTEQARKGGKT